MENYKFIILMIIIDIIILIISEILMKKYLKRKMLFPKTRLIKGSGVTNDDLDINNSVFLHMTDGIIAFDRNGVVILINPAAKQMMNISPQDTTFEDIFGRLHINLEKIIYLENWTNTEERINIDDRFLNVYFAPFKKDNDKTVGVIAVLQDITEHVKLDNMRKEFIADVSHELKTPITSIMGYADTLLEEEYDKETQSKFLNVIASEARRMAKLVTDLLTLSRYDNNNVKIEKLEFDLGDLVKRCEEKLELEEIKEFAKKVYKEKDMFFLGRGTDYAVSLEGSLKLKEISYIHSEAYASGELKHGPIALIENGVTVVATMTDERLVEKSISNVQEVVTRGAKVLLITSEDIKNDGFDTVIKIPKTNPFMSPVLSVVPMQVLSYYISKEKGLDVDKPRNLAKSVTVE